MPAAKGVGALHTNGRRVGDLRLCMAVLLRYSLHPTSQLPSQASMPGLLDTDDYGVYNIRFVYAGTSPLPPAVQLAH
jgi:hypothetical protein